MTETVSERPVERCLQLRELRIEASPLAKAPPGLVLQSKGKDEPSGAVFRCSAHHVREIFVALLPKRFILDGSSVIQLSCGPRGAEPQYQQMLGSSRFFSEDFDFPKYASSTVKERQEQLLAAIESSLLEIASICGKSGESISETTTKVRENQFRLTLEIPKLRKRIPGTDLSARVFRTLSPEAGETCTLRITKRNGELQEEVPVGPRPNFLPIAQAHYHKSALEGNAFILYDRLDREWFRYNPN